MLPQHHAEAAWRERGPRPGSRPVGDGRRRRRSKETRTAGVDSEGAEGAGHAQRLPFPFIFFFWRKIRQFRYHEKSVGRELRTALTLKQKETEAKETRDPGVKQRGRQEGGSEQFPDRARG